MKDSNESRHSLARESIFNFLNSSVIAGCLVVISSAVQVKVTLKFAGYFGTFSYPFITFKYLFFVLVGKLT
jgi:hypothetical protein